MPWMTAAAIVGTSLLGSRAAGKAADVQAAASDRAADLQYQQFREATALQEPWRQAGQRALTKLEDAVDYTPFNYNAFTADPGYAFRLAEGQKALERSAAARGGLMSGATGKALTRYGQEMGSQEYTNAFNRYQTERAAKLQPLQSLAGVGQTSAQQMGQAGMNMAGNVGEALIGSAVARGSGYAGGASALNKGLGTYLNYTQNQDMINAFNQGNVMSRLQTPAGIANYFRG